MLLAMFVAVLTSLLAGLALGGCANGTSKTAEALLLRNASLENLVVSQRHERNRPVKYTCRFSGVRPAARRRVRTSQAWAAFHCVGRRSARRLAGWLRNPA